jgi:hypothetical protein
MKNDYLNTPGDVITIAHAISIAEGYGVPGAIPTVRNNPGDIENPLGQVMNYDTVPEGWEALFRQIDLMISSRSKIYKPSMTWTEIGQLWAGGPDYMNWVNNVCRELGVAPESTLQTFVDNFHIPVNIGVSVKSGLGFSDKLEHG